MDNQLNTAPCGFLSFTDDGRIIEVNATLLELLGYEPDGLRGLCIESILPTASRVFYQTYFFPLLQMQGKAEEIYLSLQSKSGQVPMLINAARRERGGIIVNDCVLMPIWERSQYEDEILRAKKAAEDAIRASDRANAELEQQYRRQAALAKIELAINQFHELQRLLDQIVQVTTELLSASGGASIILWDAAAQSFVESASTAPGQSTRASARRGRKKGGATRWIVDHQQPLIVPDIREDRFAATAMLDEAEIQAYVGVPLLSEGNPLGVLYAHDREPRAYAAEEINFLNALAARATAAIVKVRLFEEIQRLAITDAVTGILNRRHWFELGEREFARARRFGHALSVIMMDIDHFKQFNDTYGHAIGDQVLRGVAERCQQKMRGVDSVGRYGGEEFAIILPEAKLGAARDAAERLRQSFADDALVTTIGALKVTVSLGVARVAGESENLAELLARADAALYRAKAAGRNRVECA